MDRSIEAIAATCGLIHDLGNPPFGHAGEDAIRAWFKRPAREEKLRCSLSDDQHIQDFLRFEGNAQSLRLVATLQLLADRFGLNLTYGTLSAMCKYVVASDKADSKAKNRAFRKPGYFASEADIIREIRDATGTGDARNPICFLIEAADDIVYLAADVEDAVKKGVLSWRDLEEDFAATNADPVRAALEGQRNILKAGRSGVPPDLDDDLQASAFRTAAIKVMVDAAFAVFVARYEDIMNGKHEGDLLHESSAEGLADCLRNIGQSKVYPTRSTLILELMGRNVIGDLMDLFWEGASVLPTTGTPKTSTFSGKAGALISSNYRRIFQEFAAEKKSVPEMYHRYQLVTDYVCGMTDSFAKRLHAELFNGS